MSRRTAERSSRRVEVRFWRRSSPQQQHVGFTIDVSKSGIFLGTSQQLEPGERIRLEFVDPERGFLVEGQVARVHRVSLALRHLEQPGVGVRFLSPAEMMQELLGQKGKPGQPRSVSAPPPPSSERSGVQPIPERPNPFAPPAPHADSKVVEVEFVDRASFLSVYQRDIASGGLFVTSSQSARLHEIVTVELKPPISTPNPLRFEARVVHAVLDGTNSGNAKGIGVQFLDPDRVRTTLAPLVLEMKRG